MKNTVGFRGKLMLKGGSCLVVLLTLIAMISSASAQSVQIINGLNYLKTTQNSDGSWGGTDTSINTDFYSSTVCIETLKNLNETNTQTYTNGVQWLSNYPVDNAGYIARRIVALSGENINLSADLKLLIQWQNEDGGWGGFDEYFSNNFHTALALQALRAVNYSDQSIISSALGYLVSTQNPDGGWGFYQGDDSNVYMTALVSMTLQQFPRTTSIATAINKATSYLISQQQTDGGWGSVYETAYAYIALVGATTDNTVLGNAINYLKNTQLPNGSWLQDPYSTALAIRAIYLSENRPTPPPPPTTGTVTGKVVDASTNQPLGGVTVVSGQLSATTDSTGAFSLSNIPQGSQQISFSLSGYATSTATVNIIAGSIVNLGTIPLSTNPTTGIIKGTVTDAANGQPMEGVTITVTGSFNGSTITGIDGSFIFTNVTPGSVTITASKTGYYSVTGIGMVVAGGILFFNPQLSTSPPQVTTGNLTGKVFDGSTNKPIQGATISIAGGASTTTDTQGSFLIKDITPGTYQVAISASGYISQTYQVMMLAGVTTDMQTVYLSPAPPSTTITGKVTDAQTGKPIAGAEVMVVGTSPLTGSGQVSTKTDSTGAYTITGITQLEFTLKASATGYDSFAYIITTTTYGTYTVDFQLNKSIASNIKISSLATDKGQYPSNSTVIITATLDNTGEGGADTFILAQIKDMDNKIVDVIYLQPEALHLNPDSTQTVSLKWDVGQTISGDYTITLSAVDFANGILLAEGYTAFTVLPTVVIDGVISFIRPRFINIRATETISLSAYFNNHSNVDALLSGEYEVKDPIGNVIQSDAVDFLVTRTESFKVVEVGSFTYTFSQSGQYPVKIRILSGGSVLSEITDAIHVAPSIRIEPAKGLSPTAVTPDGDKRIRINIQLKGVEDKP